MKKVNYVCVYLLMYCPVSNLKYEEEVLTQSHLNTQT